MRLVGSYASPFVRRVGITLHLYGMAFTHDPLATGDAALEPVSPLGRIPALVLDDGSILTDSSAIIDHLDEQMGDGALTPRNGAARRKVMALTALALATTDKYVAAYYETRRRPATHVWQPWLDRLNTQIRHGLAALEAQLTAPDTTAPDTTGPYTTDPYTTGPYTTGPYLTGPRLSQADVTAITALDGIALDMPALAPRSDFPELFALRDRTARLDAFRLVPPE